MHTLTTAGRCITRISRQPASFCYSHAASSLAAPVRLVAEVEPVTERFIRVFEATAQRLITVIEFISPANKRGEGLHTFRARRSELLASGVNFVEVDLVRAGDWEALLWPHHCPRRSVTIYRVVTRLPGERTVADLLPISLRDRLPSIVIPLRTNDPEVRLDLQDLIDLAYENGRYARCLNYANPCQPPLEGADAALAAQLVAAHAKAG